MLLLDFEVLMNEAGGTKTIPVNVDNICFLMPKIVPTKIMGAGDVPVTKPGTGIDFGGVRPIAVTGTIEETRKRIEEALQKREENR
jgi:hypothetical protein